MELSLSEFARCMNLDPGIVERWIRQGRMPVKRKGELCVFNPEVLKKWARGYNFEFVMPGTRAILPPPLEDPLTLRAAMKQGGFHYNLPGSTVKETLRAAVDRMEGLGPLHAREILYEKMVDREQTMSTGIGGGVAIPHPRTPVQGMAVQSLIATCFLEKPIDFKALDKKPVHVIFVLVAPSAKQHLMLLARLSFCLKDDSFLTFLESRPEPGVLLEVVERLEQHLG